MPAAMDPAAEPNHTTAPTAAAPAPATTSPWRRRLRKSDIPFILCGLYVAVNVVLRFWLAFDDWVMHGDWKQWVWQYLRFHQDGAFPPGHVVTDYQFRNQPPLWFCLMALGSHVVHPGVVATVLAVACVLATLAGCYAAVRARAPALVAALAVVLLLRDDEWFRATVGGYPRSFAPPLLFWFLWAWLTRRHHAALAVLVVGAGLYPSIVLPCALAYGVFVVGQGLRPAWRGDIRAWLGRVFALLLTGVVVATVVAAPSLWALDWWGPVITLDQAQHEPALFPGGRMVWMPLAPFFDVVGAFVVDSFSYSGALPWLELMPWSDHAAMRAMGLWLAGVGLAVVVTTLWRRRRAPDSEPHTAPSFPWELLLLAAASLLAYWLARTFAFRLYLPHRLVQHTLPHVAMLGLVFGAFRLTSVVARLVKRNTRPALVVFCLAIVPAFVAGGDGFFFGNFPDRSRDRGWLTALSTSTPIGAQVAGTLRTTDLVPYFTGRQVLVNETMSHPFRPGYFAEMKRRIELSYAMLYASDPALLLRVAQAEDVHYLVVEERSFAELDREVFEPLRAPLEALRAEGERNGFALKAVPSAALLYDGRATDGVFVVDIAALARAWGAADGGPGTDATRPASPSP